MENYLKKAILNGTAIDCYKEPERVRKMYEDGIGFMKDVIEGTDKFIDDRVNFWKSDREFFALLGKHRTYGVAYIIDIENDISKFKSSNSLKYISLLIKTLLK